MTMINYGIIALAIGWIVWYFVHLRRQLLSGAMLVPPVMAAALVFIPCIVLVILTGVSPLHLIWLFPVSFLIGFVLLLFPPMIKWLLFIVGLLIGPTVNRVQPRTGRKQPARQGGKSSRHATGTRRRTQASRRRKSR